MQSTQRMPPRGRPVMAARIDRVLRDEAFALAEQQGRPVSSLVADALAAYLAQHRKDEAA